MRVTLHNPKREVDLSGPMPVGTMLSQLGLLRESVLVIRGDSLVTGDTMLRDEDEIDIRPVISGGAT